MTGSHPTIAQMVSRAADLFEIHRAEILAATKERRIFRARAAVALAARRHGYSSVQIGRHLGQRDHSTILSAQHRAEQWAKESPRFAARVEAIAE